MNRMGGVAAATAIALFLGATAAPALAAGPAPVVFFDIAVPSLAPQAAFYHDIFDWQINAEGGFSVPVTSPLGANLRVETPTDGPLTERVVYVGVPDVNATMAKIVAHGGSVVFPRMIFPGVAIVALFKDPVGNRMGLVEVIDGKPIVPPKH